MSCYGPGGHRSLLVGVVWVWVQIQRKCWTLLQSEYSCASSAQGGHTLQANIILRTVCKKFLCEIKSKGIISIKTNMKIGY